MDIKSKQRELMALFAKELGIEFPLVGDSVWIQNAPYVVLDFNDNMPGYACVAPKVQIEAATGGKEPVLLSSTWAYLPSLYEDHQKAMELMQDPTRLAAMMSKLEGFFEGLL